MLGAIVLALVTGSAAPSPTAPTSDTARQSVHDATIVLVVSPGAEDGRSERRIRAELEAAGFTVRTERAALTTVADTLASLRRLGQRHGAVASIHLSSTRGRIELWLDDRVTGKATTRMLDVDDTRPEETDAVVAARVVEALQASLLEILTPTKRDSPAAVEPPEAARALVRAVERPRVAPTWGIRGGVTVAGAPGGYTTMAGPGLAGFIAFGSRRRLVLDADAYGTALQSHLASPYGEVASGLATIRAHVGWWPLPDARVSPGVGIGGGMLVAWAAGDATVGNVQGNRDASVVGLPSAGLGIAVRIARKLRIRIDAHVGLPMPRVAIEVDGRSLATVSWPLVDGALTVEGVR